MYLEKAHNHVPQGVLLGSTVGVCTTGPLTMSHVAHKCGQGHPLSQILFVILMSTSGISGLLLFADDTVMLASSDFDLQHTLGRFTVACEMVEMKVSTFKRDAWIL